MIEVSMERSKWKQPCCGCNSIIEKEAPMFILYNIGGAMKIDIILCEDCGNNLQNDINDEYQKFVELGE